MGFKIDGIATNQNIDSSGEILHIDNHDISDLIDGKGVLNWEHNNDAPDDIIGHIIYARKILKKDDCENDRQEKYFEMSNGPYVYIISELFDDEDHPGGVAAAALIRYYHKRKEPVLAGFSIEGNTLERDDNHLLRSVGRRVALTLRPANKSCISDVLDDKELAEVYKKSNSGKPSLIKSIQVNSIILEDTIEDIQMELDALKKTLEAGNYDVAPSSLVGGAALQVEDRSMRNRVKAVVRDWDRKRPLREMIKAALPEVSDDYVDHFTRLAEDLTLKKSGRMLVRVSADHSKHPEQTDKQRELLEGLYLDKDLQNVLYSKTLRNDSGKDVHFKKPIPVQDPDACPYRNATAYSDLAHNVFGMGDHVPVSNHFSHPEIGSDPNHVMSAQEIPEGARSLMEQSMRESQDVKNAHEDGTLHKLALMDAIMGHGHRHGGNTLVDKNGKVQHIDNEGAFRYEEPAMPTYLHELVQPEQIEKADTHPVMEGIQQAISGVQQIRSAVRGAKQAVNSLKPSNMISRGRRQFARLNPVSRPLNNAARDWLMATNPRILARRMFQIGMNHASTNKAVYRLMSAQRAASMGRPIDAILHTMGAIHEGIG